MHPLKATISAAALLCATQLLSACAADDAAEHANPDASSQQDTGADAADGGAAECTVTAPTSCAEPALRYADVEPIFQKRCVICHLGQEASPWPLTTYSHVADWSAEIRGAVLSCSMPPPADNVPITDDERSDILMWLRCGALK